MIADGQARLKHLTRFSRTRQLPDAARRKYTLVPKEMNKAEWPECFLLSARARDSAGRRPLCNEIWK